MFFKLLESSPSALNPSIEFNASVSISIEALAIKKPIAIPTKPLTGKEGKIFAWDLAGNLKQQPLHARLAARVIIIFCQTINSCLPRNRAPKI